MTRALLLVVRSLTPHTPTHGAEGVQPVAESSRSSLVKFEPTNCFPLRPSLHLAEWRRACQRHLASPSAPSPPNFQDFLRSHPRCFSARQRATPIRSASLIAIGVASHADTQATFRLTIHEHRRDRRGLLSGAYLITRVALHAPGLNARHRGSTFEAPSERTVSAAFGKIPQPALRSSKPRQSPQCPPTLVSRWPAHEPSDQSTAKL